MRLPKKNGQAGSWQNEWLRKRPPCWGRDDLAGHPAFMVGKSVASRRVGPPASEFLPHRGRITAEDNSLAVDAGNDGGQCCPAFDGPPWQAFSCRAPQGCQVPVELGSPRSIWAELWKGRGNPQRSSWGTAGGYLESWSISNKTPMTSLFRLPVGTPACMRRSTRVDPYRWFPEETGWRPDDG